MRPLFTLLVYLLITAQIYSQGRGNNTQIWLDYYPSFEINERLLMAGDYGYRTLIGDERWNLVYLRPSVRYYLNETFELRGGIGFFYEFNGAISDRFEMRPWQGVNIYWPKLGNFKWFRIDHLIRFEERISFLTENSWAGSFDFRGRYRFRGTLNLCIECENPQWSVPSFIEFFIPFNGVEEAFSDRTRVAVGLDYDMSPSWKFGFLFNWQGSRTGRNEDIKIDEFIFQLKVRHYMDKKPRIFNSED